MSKELVVPTLDDALRILLDENEDADWSDLQSVTFGSWASTHIEIEGNFHSELNGPFLAAYSHINDELLRLFALSKYGNGDIRSLKQEDLVDFEFRVKVQDGSSKVDDNLWKLLGKLSHELVGKMTGRELVVTVLGLGLLSSSYFGGVAYLEGKKEVRLEEIRSIERRQALEATQFASRQQAEQFAAIVKLMSEQNAISKRAVDAALSANEQLLKAASKTGPTVIGDVHLNPNEARELLGTTRRSAVNKIVEQEMKVVDVNTADPVQTSVIIEDPSTKQQHRVAFGDRMIDVTSRNALLTALDKRSTAWFRLKMRSVEDEVVSVEILSIAAEEPK